MNKRNLFHQAYRASLEGKLVELFCANPKRLWLLGMNPVWAPNLVQHKYLLHSQLQKPLARPRVLGLAGSEFIFWDRANFLG